MPKKTNSIFPTINKQKYSKLNEFSFLKRSGLIIKKENIDTKTLGELKTDLTLKAVVHKDYAKFAPKVKAFMENKKYIYIPPFWGRENIGIPPKNLVKDGVPFTSELKTIYPPRDYQLPFLDKAMKQMNEIGGAVLTAKCAFGKCHGFNTPIMMYDGTIKMVQDVKVGDQLMGDDSTPRNVLSLARGREMMYKVIPKRGTPYVVNESHILSLKCSTKCRYGNKGDVFDIPLKEYLKLSKKYHGRGSPICGYKVPVNFSEKELPIDPYLLGVWLGDGCSSNTIISNQEAVILKYVKDKVKEYNCFLQYRSQYDYAITSLGKRSNHFTGCRHNFLKKLRELNLINNKHIPHIYKCNSRENRLKLLAGLIDTDGYLHQSGLIYTMMQKNNKLTDDIVYLCRSLGFACYPKKVKKSCMYKGEKREGIYNSFSISGFSLEDIPVLCPRKKYVLKSKRQNPLNSLITVEKLKEDDYYGFTIDGNHRYLLGDFTVTHNTFCAIYLATLLKQKTLILVHNTVLLDQWIDRISYFCPDAKIGKIKGKAFEVEGKDFVIGMLQTVVREDRGYTNETFKDFGFVVSDECHHISSPMFSKALPIISTKYKLGLSATPQRNDRLENIFFWWLGPMIEVDLKVEKPYTLVKVVNYYDDDFEEKKTWTGGFNLAEMTDDIISNHKRNEFIIKNTRHYAKLGRQVLVLSTRRSHLELLKEMFEAKPLKKDNKKLATAGMYVGGMKSNVAQGLDALKTNEIDEIIEKNIDKVVDKKHKKLLWDKEGNRKMKDGKVKVMGSRKQKIALIEESNIKYVVEKKASLEESAKCDVLFATYQLVSEGTDIPTLNTLIMTSSRKEVEQIVGRIQRAKNAHKPMVLDICDMFSVYQNQGKYRQRFYRSQEYHIDYVDYDATNTEKIPIISDQEDEVPCNKLKGLKVTKKTSKSNDKEPTFNHKMLLELMDSDDD